MTRVSQALFSLVGVCLTASLAAAPLPPGDPVVVVVIEDRAGDRVITREILTRDALDRLAEEQSGRLTGFGDDEPATPAESPWTAPGEEEDSAPPSDPDAIFEVSRQGLLGDVDATEGDTEEEDAPPGQWVPPLGLDERLLSTHRAAHANEDEQRQLDLARRRLMRDFENEMIEDWIERTALLIEARRRGHTADPIHVAEALIPMLQARHAQLESDRESGERTVADTQVDTVSRTLNDLQRDPQTAHDPTTRQSLRDEIVALLRDEGHDPDRFFRELEENILIEQLIRDTVYDFYTEENLHTYHAARPDQFILPPRLQLLAIKSLRGPDITHRDLEETVDIFRGLERRLRRIDADEPLDAVVAAWNEAMHDTEDLLPRTYLHLSPHMTAREMPPEIIGPVMELEAGETTLVSSDRGVFLIRLIEELPPFGENFDDVRPQVEEVFFEQVRGQLVERLRDGEIHIFKRRRGAPLSEALALFGSPDAPAPVPE